MNKGAAETLGKKGKAWVIGLDGATFTLIKPWVEAGKLPAFARLLKCGAHGILRSPIPQSPPAWASFMTGCNPGKHGIFDWIQPYPRSYKEHVTLGASSCCPSLWKLLSDSGRRVGVVNVPMTYPPENINGFLVSGLDTPYGNEEFTYPPDLLKDLSKRFGPYTVLPVIVNIPLQQTVRNFLDTIEQREKVLHFLLERESLDLFVLVFNATDCLQHLCLSGFGGKELNSPLLLALLSIYQRLDAVLAGLLERLPEDTTLFVLSDHGAGPIHAYLHLDNWLYMQGWLHFADKSPRLALKQKRAHIFEWIRGGLRKLFPEWIRCRFRERAKGLKSLLDSAASAPYIDWARTQAFCFTSQGIYINVRGRQPSGTVLPGREYEQLCDGITEALYSLRDSNLGLPVVAKVSRKEEIFSGSHLDVAPDLYIHWTDDAYLSWDNPLHPRDQLFVRPKALEFHDVVPQSNQGQHVGCHRQEGILTMFGSRLKTGIEIPESSIIDVAPTILYLMGEPIPAYMEGQVIQTAIDDGYLKKNPVRYADMAITGSFAQKGYRPEEVKRAEEKLRDLGYL